jgi:RsiW-degrading membrane proteinase PrsW (M82 family)
MTRFQSVLVVLLITFFTHVASEGEEDAPIDKKKAGNPEIYDGLIAGVGPGTFAILFASFIGFLMCLLKNGSSNPRLMVVLAVLLPVFVFLVVKSLPVKSLSSEQVQNEDLPEDAYLLRSAFILGFIVVTFIAMSFCVFFSSISTQLIGQRIHSQSLAEFKKSQSQLELVKKQAADEEMDQSMQND